MTESQNGKVPGTPSERAHDQLVDRAIVAMDAIRDNTAVSTQCKLTGMAVLSVHIEHVIRSLRAQRT